MSKRPKFKQIFGFQEAWMTAGSFAATGTTDNVTTALTATTTADDVPLQPGTQAPPTQPENIVQGLVVTGSGNKVEIFDSATKRSIKNDEGYEIYGRLTEAAGVYTLSYYFDDGTEQAQDIGSITIDFSVGYIYPMDKWPLDATRRLRITQIGEDPTSQVGRPINDEVVTVTALNTLADLAKTPSPNTTVWLAVNNLPAHEGASQSFTRSGKTITWDPVDAEYDLVTTDQVIAHYFTLEA